MLGILSKSSQKCDCNFLTLCINCQQFVSLTNLCSTLLITASIHILAAQFNENNAANLSASSMTRNFTQLSCRDCVLLMWSTSRPGVATSILMPRRSLQHTINNKPMTDTVLDQKISRTFPELEYLFKTHSWDILSCHIGRFGITQ